MRLVYRAQALDDISGIQHYLEHQSPSGARNVLRSIYASIQLVSENPVSYQRTDNPDIRVHAVRRYRYKIFYIVTGDTVEIVHVRHSARRAWTP